MEGEDGAESSPEHKLVQSKWRTTTEQVWWTLLEWDSEKSLCWRSIVTSQLNWPSLVSIVSSAGIFEWNNKTTCWNESNQRSIEMLVRVVVSILLWRPGTSIAVLPRGKLKGGTSSSSNVGESKPDKSVSGRELLTSSRAQTRSLGVWRLPWRKCCTRSECVATHRTGWERRCWSASVWVAQWSK